MEIITAILAIWIVASLMGYFSKIDDTDLNRDKRSNMRLFIDYGTGCHYVGTAFGGITPRLDAEGRHICTPENKRQ